MMEEMSTLSRRALFGLLPSLRAFALSQLQVERLASGLGAIAPPRRFRADATIVLLGMSVWRRQNVGHALLGIDYRDGRFRADFAAGADPQRAKGLKNLGWLSEVVLERPNETPESAYFGFLTSSPEDGRQAKAALARSNEPVATFSALEGINQNGVAKSLTLRFDCAAPKTPAQWPEVAARAKRELLEGEHPWRTMQLAQRGSTGSFLYSVWKSALDRRTSLGGEYCYNDRFYSYTVEKSTDEAVGRELAARALLQDPGRLIRLRGLIRRKDDRSETPFTVWYDNSPVPTPLRIEWSPRSFLRLTFELESRSS